MKKSNIPDEKDKKILSILHLNSRTPLAKIGGEVSLSKDAVLYRINKLVKTEVISKFFLDVNYKILGYDKYTLFLRLHVLTPEEEQKFLQVVQQIPEIIFCAQCTGQWDFWLEILADSVRSVDRLLENVLKEKNVQEYQVMILSKTYKEYDPLLKNDLPPKIIPSSPIITIDESDYSILKALENDARQHILDIAKKTGMSVDTITSRLQKLQEKSLVKYDLVVNYNTLGYHLSVLVLEINSSQGEALYAYLLADPHVRSFSALIGNRELVIEVLSQDKKDYLLFLNALRSYFFALIIKYSEVSVIKDIKDMTVPVITFEKQ